MSQLKLTADSGGGTVAIKGPASTADNAAIELTVPGTGNSTLATTSTAGKILQVLQAVKTDTTSTASTSFGDLTGFSQAITTTGSNKVLVRVNLKFGVPAGNCLFFRLARTTSGSTNELIHVGDTSSSRVRTTMGGLAANANWEINPDSCEFLDSPGAGTHTYFLRWRVSSGSSTAYLNKSERDQDADHAGRTPSTITVMEVAA